MSDSTNPWVIDGKEVKFAYFDNVTFAYFIQAENKNFVRVLCSASVCHMGKDTYDKRLGRKIAFGRLNKGGFFEGGLSRVHDFYVEKKDRPIEQNNVIRDYLESTLVEI